MGVGIDFKWIYLGILAGWVDCNLAIEIRGHSGTTSILETKTGRNVLNP